MKRAFAILLVAAAGCNPQPARTAAPAPAASASASAPALTITGRGTRSQPVRMSAQNGNRKTYQLVAKSYTAHSAQNATQTNVALPTVTFYAKDGTKMTATAPRAAVQSGKEIVLSGGVHATTSTGLTLTCDELTFDQRTEMLQGERNVRITGMQGGAQQLLTGNHFTSNVKLTNMVIR
ncbi:MAG: LPS export ABC transporter periplasmic protein LptC [Candidatus Baltobacteraceae bacterium]